MHLELYYYKECPFCRIVLSTIRQLGIEKQITMKNTRESSEYRDELVARNGRRQVPCLLVDGKPMLESRDISAFLMSEFGDETTKPPSFMNQVKSFLFLVP